MGEQRRHRPRIETVKVFLDKGIDIDGTFTPFIVPENPMESQEPQFASRGERTKYQLLKAGEKLFGEKGFEKNTANRNHV